MPLPQPEDFADRIRALEQAVRDLKSSITNQGGLTEVSAGWVMRDQSTPSTPPSGDIHIYGQDGRLWVLSTLGDQMLEPVPDFPQADLVTIGTVSIDSAPSSYDQAHSAQLRSAIFTINNAVVALLLELRSSGLMSSI